MNVNEIILVIVVFTLLLLLLVAGIVVSFHIANRQRLQKDIKLQEASLRYEQELRVAETAISEAVLKNVSHELHDNIGHLLTSLRLQLESRMLDDEQQATRLQPLQETLVAASQQLRLLSRTLNPDFFQNSDLISAIKLDTERLQLVSNIKLHFKYDNERTGLSKEQELLAFRIFQEGITNAIKHANAKNISINITQNNGFCLSIADDGIGFAQDASRENGLQNMRSRAKLAGLQLEITAAPGKGCRLVLSQPL